MVSVATILNAFDGRAANAIAGLVAGVRKPSTRRQFAGGGEQPVAHLSRSIRRLNQTMKRMTALERLIWLDELRAKYPTVEEAAAPHSVSFPEWVSQLAICDALPN